MIKLGGIITLRPMMLGDEGQKDVPTKGSNAVKGGVSSAGNSIKEAKSPSDIVSNIKNGSGWATADYILNNAHMNLGENERIVSLLKLAKEGMLVDEELIEGTEKEYDEIPESAFMSVKRVAEKYSKIKDRYNESVESLSDKIAKFTGLRASAVQRFIEDNNLDGEALYKYVKNGKLKERMDLVTAMVGTPGNRIFKRIVKQFSS